MAKYVPPRSRKPHGVSDEEAEKRRQRYLRFQTDSGDKSAAKSPQNGMNNLSSKPYHSNKPPLYGFVSRGEDSRLQTSEHAQREYFDWILQTFNQTSEEKTTKVKDANEKASSESTAKCIVSVDSTLSALRKLREAILHQKPSEFSVKVHLFSVRVSTPVGHYQTYVPSINYLLSSIDMLSEIEVSEVATLLVLHISHDNNENEKAFRVFDHYLLRERNRLIYKLLVAWATGDYYTWLKMYNSEPGHSIQAIMTGGLTRMMAHMVECMTRSFFTVSIRDFEEKFLPCGVTLGEFVEKYAPNWHEEAANLVIRQRGK